MATKKTDETPKPPAKRAPEEPKTYKVFALKPLGSSITGGGRLDVGAEGEISIEPSRYARLKKAEYFK